MLVPRLPQNTSNHGSNVNIECDGKSNNCILCVTSFLEHWYILILLFWKSILVNYVYMVAPLQQQLQEYHYTRAKLWRKNIVAVITQCRMINDNLKRQIKNRTLYTCRVFLLTRVFQNITNWSKAFEHLPTLFLRYT